MSRTDPSRPAHDRRAARRARRPIRFPLCACVLGALTLPTPAQDCASLADVSTVGEGTPGSAGVPELLAVGLPAVGQPGMGVALGHGQPGAAAWILVGLPGPATPLPAYGALLLAAPPLARVPVRLDETGASPVLFQTAAPTPPALCGLLAVAQGVVIDPAAQGGAAFTAGLQLRLGAGQAAAGLYDLTLHYLVPEAFKTARPAMAVADLDGNGRPDIVVPTGTGPVSDLRVLRQLADGTLAPPLAFPLDQPAGAVDLVLADLDDDGLLDAATAHADAFTSSVVLLRGAGDGGFGAAELLGPAPGGTSRALAAGDVTGDGRDDLVVAGWTAASVAVLAGPIGPGPAGPAALIAMPSPAVVRGARLGDVDGDGLLDVLVLLTGGEPRVLVARSLGNGAFAAPLYWPAGLHDGRALDAADVDLDGDDDAIVLAGTSSPQPHLAVLLSDGAGGAVSAPLITLPPDHQFLSTQGVILADLDEDVLPDVLVTWGNFAAVRLINLGGGLFAASEEVEYTGTVSRLADMDGDGRADLVALNQLIILSSVWWQAGDGAGAFEMPPALPDGMPEGPTRAADLDGDGDLDLVAWPNAGILPSVVGVTLNDGRADFAPTVTYQTGGSVRDVVLADMDDDGVLDIVTAGGAGASILPGLGDGSFGPAVVVPLPSTLAVRAADTDGDDLPELILGSTMFPSALRVFPNLGGLAFGAPATTQLPVQPIVFDVGDLNGDGDPEAVVQAGANVLLLAGTSGPGFAAHVVLSDPQAETGLDFPLQLADVDADGDTDMLRRTFTLHTEVWLNDGTGALSISQWAWWEAIGPMTVVDANGDGAPDIVGEGVMLGLGGGQFAAPQPGAVAHVHGDLDGDGRPDGAAFGRLFLNRLP